MNVSVSLRGREWRGEISEMRGKVFLTVEMGEFGERSVTLCGEREDFVKLNALTEAALMEFSLSEAERAAQRELAEAS